MFGWLRRKATAPTPPERTAWHMDFDPAAGDQLVIVATQPMSPEQMRRLRDAVARVAENPPRVFALENGLLPIVVRHRRRGAWRFRGRRRPRYLPDSRVPGTSDRRLNRDPRP